MGTKAKPSRRRVISPHAVGILQKRPTAHGAAVSRRFAREDGVLRGFDTPSLHARNANNLKPKNVTNIAIPVPKATKIGSISGVACKPKELAPASAAA